MPSSSAQRRFSSKSFQNKKFRELDRIDPCIKEASFSPGKRIEWDDPRLLDWRNNLTALSHAHNLYFVIFNSSVYVYEPQFPTQALTEEPTLIFNLPVLFPGRSGYISLHLGTDFYHSVNHVVVAEFGADEILLCACDDGDVLAYYTKSIARAVSRRRDLRGATGGNVCDDLRPFFHESVQVSAWGLAVHKEARMIAVSSNTHIVTVFAFALALKGRPGESSRGRGESDNSMDSDVECESSGLKEQAKAEAGIKHAFQERNSNDVSSEESESDAEGGVPLLREPARDASSGDSRELRWASGFSYISYDGTPARQHRFETRTEDLRMELSGHLTNIPCVAFNNTPEDRQGRYLVSTDIDGNWIVWDLQTTLIIRSSAGLSGGPAAEPASGWGLHWIDKRAFRRTTAAEAFSSCEYYNLTDGTIAVLDPARGRLKNASTMWDPRTNRAHGMPLEPRDESGEELSEDEMEDEDDDHVTSQDVIISEITAETSSEVESQQTDTTRDPSVAADVDAEDEELAADTYDNEDEPAMMVTPNQRRRQRRRASVTPNRSIVHEQATPLDIPRVFNESRSVGRSRLEIFRRVSFPERALSPWAPDRSNLSSEEPQVRPQSKEPTSPLFILMATDAVLHQIAGARVHPALPTMYMRNPLAQGAPMVIWQTLAHHDRMNMSVSIPELGIVLAGSNKGRVAVFTLWHVFPSPFADVAREEEQRLLRCRDHHAMRLTGKRVVQRDGRCVCHRAALDVDGDASGINPGSWPWSEQDMKASSRGVYTIRLDAILPFSTQEQQGQRPLQPLVGVAASPMQGGLRDDHSGTNPAGVSQQDSAPRSWRVLLLYRDQTTMTYEISRRSRGDGGLEDVVFV